MCIGPFRLVQVVTLIRRTKFSSLFLTIIKGGVARAIQKVRTFWNETLDSFG
jgi:hypothetical protein